MKTLRSIHLTFCCLAFLSFGGSEAKAQSFYDIEGGVYGPNTRALGGVAVFLEDLTRSRIAQAITDTDGRYRFTRVGAGIYFIVVNPNDRQMKPAVHRIELINTARSGTNSSIERVDITLSAFPRPPSATPGTVFAQDVPAAAQTEYERAMQSLANKDNELALRQLTQAIRIFPNYFLASQQLGLLHVEKAEYQQAIVPLVKAIEVNPKAGPSYLALGIASLELGRSDLALDALERSRQLDDKSFRVHFFLGRALLSLNRYDEAESSFKESYRLGGPSRAAQARLHLASMYSQRGRNREAINELEGYLRDNPKAGNSASVREAINKLKTKL